MEMFGCILSLDTFVLCEHILWKNKAFHTWKGFCLYECFCYFQNYLPSPHPISFIFGVFLKKKLNLLMSALFPQIQINMQRKMRFTGIVTQGASRMGTAEFIKAFKVASSLDGKTYTMYRTEGERKDRVRRRNTTQQNQCTVVHTSICFKLFYWPSFVERCASQDTSTQIHITHHYVSER